MTAEIKGKKIVKITELFKKIMNQQITGTKEDKQLKSPQMFLRSYADISCKTYIQ